uniref:Fibroin P25 n=1 Tax=Hyphantria cunea TaxID=39466 RepID=A0A9E8G2I3_HYPCU|nr:fibroin P25 [Hyphantria cunea]
MLLKGLLILLGAHYCYADLSNIIRPCKLNHYKCIGENLAANSYCKVKENGFLPSKYVQESFHYDTPYFNASYIDHNLIIRNQDKCYVSDFFVNTRTGRAVFCMDCPNLDFESDRTMIQHRTCQEDSYYEYHFRGVYPMIRITINLPSATHMDLCSASIFTDVSELPKLHINPKNKPTANYLSKDFSHLYIYERENGHARGPGLAYKFIDSLICDYGCPMPK